jgi:hypothetical protein
MERSAERERMTHRRSARLGQNLGTARKIRRGGAMIGIEARRYFSLFSFF